jgi:hypothetical protein
MRQKTVQDNDIKNISHSQIPGLYPPPFIIASPFEKVLSVMTVERRNSKTAQCKCPAHNDQKASLTVTEKPDGVVLLHCHAGCNTEDVLKAGCLTLSDLYPAPKKGSFENKSPDWLKDKPTETNGHTPGKKQVEAAVYPYTDEHGKELFQCVRMEPKTFRQRRNENGHWVYNLDGVRRVLFGLPFIVKAVQSGLPVFIVEGEKDVMNLEALGIVATTNPMGAGKWRPEYSEFLKGAEVVILPDNDEPGRKHARQVAESLKGLAKSVKVLELPGLPEKNDVSDWIAKGGTAEDLQRLASEAPEYAQLPNQPEIPTRKKLFASAAERLNECLDIDWLIENIIEAGTTNSTFGPSGSGKSFVELDKALCIATGKDWNGHKIVRPGAVLILAGEGRGGIYRRIKAWTQYHKIEPATLTNVFISEHTLVMDGSNTDEICSEVSDLKISYLLIDTLARHIDGNENDTADMGKFISAIDELRDRLNTTITVVHHTGLNDSTRGRGSSAFKAALDSEILCKDGVLEWTKTKDMDVPEQIFFKLEKLIIGVDKHGKDVTTCVPVYGERPPVKNSMLTAHEKDAIKALINVCVIHPVKNSDNRYVGDLDSWREEIL